MAIVIVVIPIAIGVPAASVLVPPAMSLPPAAFPRFMQFVASMFRLAAIPTVMFRSFVEFVICLGDAPLASLVVISIGAWGPCNSQQANQGSCRQ